MVDNPFSSSPTRLPLSVIIVSADSGASLRESVRCVLACDMPLELLLIDNGSVDGVPQAIARAHESDHRLQVLYNHANLGFGPAVNRAVAQSNGELLLVLNPDCLPTESDVQRLLDVMETEPHAGLLGVVVCDANGIPDPASYRRDPLLRRALNSLFGGTGERVAVGGAMPDQLVEAEAVSGALMLLRRNVFERLEGFDEAYFLHCEDLDLCRRVRDAGYQVLLVGDVRVLHGKGGSSRHRPVFVSYHKHRGMWRWFRKFDPAARNPLLAGLVWLGLWARFGLQVPAQVWRRARSEGRGVGN